MNFSGILIPLLAVFIQTTSNGITEDIITGEILLAGNNEIFFNITEPVHQQMQLTSRNTIIYYPDDMRAFNIEHNSTDLRTQSIPQIEPLDSNYYDQLGYKKVNETTSGDTVVIQYISLTNKKNPSLITQKTINGNTAQLIVASNLASKNYLQLDFIEYGLFNEKEYIKNYSVSSFNNGKLIEKTTYNITDIKNAENADLERIKFIIPPEINIEVRSFN